MSGRNRGPPASQLHAGVASTDAEIENRVSAVVAGLIVQIGKGSPQWKGKLDEQHSLDYHTYSNRVKRAKSKIPEAVQQEMRAMHAQKQKDDAATAATAAQSSSSSAFPSMVIAPPRRGRTTARSPPCCLTKGR